MSRMLEALKVLEDRRREEPPAIVLHPAAMVDAPPVEPPITLAVAEPEPHAVEPDPVVTGQRCTLPLVSEVGAPLLALANRVSEQLSINCCNVLMFAGVDHVVESCLSMTELAQAFALQSPGRVLLVDGDLRCARLSKSVCPAGPGVIEVMQGTARWSEVIHPTNLANVDFAACGHAQVPTLDRPEFAWNELRPTYRAVLVGLAPADEPETRWLAARCDGVYLVLSRLHATRQAASASVAGLRAAGANALGCVVADR